ncbi:MAG: glycosyltransferase family 39 protein [Bacteroidia bacterium]
MKITSDIQQQKSKISNNQFWLVLIGFVTFNFLFKLFRIGGSSFSYDEMMSVKNTFLDFGHIKHESEWDANPPFYYYCLWVWAKLFGSSEIAIRSMSAFFSALAIIPFSVWLKNKLHKNALLLFLIGFSIHPYLFYYAQEARCYSLLLFLTGINALLTWRLIERTNYLYILLLGISNFLLVYTHYVSGLILVVQFIIITLYSRNLLWKVLVSDIIAILLVLLRFTKKQWELLFGFSNTPPEQHWIKSAQTDDLINLMSSFYGNIIVYIVLIAFTFFMMYRKKFFSQFSVYCLLLGIMAPLVFYLMGISIPIFIPRYILFSVPFFLILISYSFSHNKISTFILSVLFFAFGVFSLKPGENKGLNMKAFVATYTSLDSKPDLLFYKHDVIGMFTYYYKNEEFDNVSKRVDANINDRDIYRFVAINELTIHHQNKPILVCSYFYSPEEIMAISERLHDLGYKQVFDGKHFELQLNYFIPSQN